MSDVGGGSSVQDRADEAPEASIVIVTKDRPADLRLALASAVAQTGAVEVLVIDDGSSDGIAGIVAEEFPTVRLLRSPTSVGYIRQRNRGAREAHGRVIVSIDDDAEFTAPHTVARMLEAFDEPRVGAIAMPFVQERRGTEVLQRAPSGDAVWVTNAFIGCAHALRRDVFLTLGGYGPTLEHLFEEPDYCMRMLRAGYVVRLGTTPPIIHHESPLRDPRRDLAQICRNHVLLTWLYVPFPDWLLRGAQILGYVLHAVLVRRFVGPPLRGLWAGLRYVATHRQERQPLDRPTYRLFRRLKRRPARLAEIEAALTQLPGTGSAHRSPASTACP